MKYIFFFALLITSFVSAQVSSDLRNAFDSYIDSNITRADEEANLEGSPFLVDNFQSAYVSVLERSFLVRYNAYKDLFQIKDEQGLFYFDKSKVNIVLDLGNNQRFKSFFLPDNTYNYFRLVTSNARINLIEKNYKVANAAKPARTSYDKPKPASYSSLISKYYLAVDDTVKEFKLKEKELYEIFPNLEDAIKSYIKENKLKAKNIEDLEKILAFIETKLI